MGDSKDGWQSMVSWTPVSGPAPGKVFDMKYIDNKPFGWRVVALTDQGVFELDSMSRKWVAPRGDQPLESKEDAHGR